MNYEKIGQVIRELRKNSKMTQQELAKDICTQAQISKLENGDEIPSCITLYYISKKLGVDVNYFFEITHTPRLDYVKEVKNLIREYVRTNNYHEVESIVKAENNTPLFKSGPNRQFLLWNEGLCDFYIHGLSHYALEKLNFALSLTLDPTKLVNERELEILNSIGVIYKRTGDFNKAYDTFEHALEKINMIPKIEDFKVKIKLLYNMSKACFNNDEYDRSLTYCQDGVELCKQNESFYLLGELLYQEGRCYYIKSMHDMAYQQYQKALSMFYLLEKSDYISVVTDALEEVQHYSSHTKVTESNLNL